jgi:hypothetical protein
MLGPQFRKVKEMIMATACSEKTTNMWRAFLLKTLRIVSLLSSAVGWFWAALYLSWGNTDAGTEYYNKLARQVRRLNCNVFSSLIRNISRGSHSLIIALTLCSDIC